MKNKAKIYPAETAAKIIFLICGAVAILAVFSITVYMIATVIQNRYSLIRKIRRQKIILQEGLADEI